MRARGRFHADGLLADAPAKRALVRGGAIAVDMESHIAARVAAAHGLPFAILRVVSDRVDDEMPPAVLVSMGPKGTTAYAAGRRQPRAPPGANPGVRAVRAAQHGVPRGAEAGRVRFGPRLGAAGGPARRLTGRDRQPNRAGSDGRQRP